MRIIITIILLIIIVTVVMIIIIIIIIKTVMIKSSALGRLSSKAVVGNHPKRRITLISKPGLGELFSLSW